MRDALDCGGDAATGSERDARERSVAGCTTAGMIDLHANKVSMRLTWTQPGGWRKLRRLTISVVAARLEPRRDPDRPEAQAADRGRRDGSAAAAS